MKIISMYLPQFYQTVENDKWWGKGFTEWTAVKESESLFEGHNQPREPLNKNYYNLLEKKIMQWQCELMQKYGVFGMCFYHYYFKDGKKTLEKPAENLLEWKDIQMPFCFSWANESWTRTWSKLNDKNVWISKFEDKMHNDNDDGILLQQSYGTEKDWKKHFEYLLPFFKDKRYIKIDEKPLFLIYKPLSIPCLERMVDYWRKLAIENDLKGIYFVGTNIQETGVLDALMRQEPQYTESYYGTEKFLEKDKHIGKYIDGKRLWEKIINQKISTDKKTYLCGFVGYDDTPRRGRAGTVVSEILPKEFKENMKKMLLKSETLGNEVIFMNAWNEWGESMYLEPDQKYQYAYLEALKSALDTYSEIGYIAQENISRDNTEGIVERYRSYWTILNKWLCLKEEGKSLIPYFQSRGYQSIAVYGIGLLGRHFLKEIESSELEIKYGIDEDSTNIHEKFPVYSPRERLPEADVIIVTTTYAFGKVYLNLKQITDVPIISLTEIFEDL